MDRVLEIGGCAAGFCGRLFVQSGYEVVRIEPPEPQSAPTSWVSPDAMDLYLHANKRRVRTSDPGLIAALADQADIVVAQAPTAHAIEDLGIDQWRSTVKVAITPFGRTGPKRNWNAASSVVLAMGGYTNLMGDQQRAPLTLPGHYPEFQSGAYAYTAAQAARIAGPARAIDIGMLEVVMSLSQFTTVMWHCAGRVRSRHGSDFWWVVPTNLFRCADGWVYLNIVPTFWDPFATFIERPEILLDERFTTNDLRMTNRDALHAIIDEALAPLTRREIQQRATDARIPLGAVLTLDDVLADPHLNGRGVFQDVTGPDGVSVRSPRPAWHIHGEPAPQLTLTEIERG